MAPSLPASPRASKDSPLFILERITVDQITGCWNWAKSLNPKTGYGQVGFPPYTAHRLSFILFNGPIQEGLILRHQCANRRCCNPDHLLTGTHLDNYWDSRDVFLASAKARRGTPPVNRKPVTVNGVEYESQVAAIEALHVTYKTLLKLAA